MARVRGTTGDAEGPEIALRLLNEQGTPPAPAFERAVMAAVLGEAPRMLEQPYALSIALLKQGKGRLKSANLLPLPIGALRSVDADVNVAVKTIKVTDKAEVTDRVTTPGLGDEGRWQVGPASGGEVDDRDHPIGPPGQDVEPCLLGSVFDVATPQGGRTEPVEIGQRHQARRSAFPAPESG